MTHQIKHLHTTYKIKRHGICRICLILLLLLTSATITLAQTHLISFGVPQNFVSTSVAQGKQEELKLEPEKPIDGELTGGTSHNYRVALTAGQYLHAFVEHRGIDVVLKLRGPNGTPLTEMDGLRSTSGTEELSWEAASTGWYVLEILGKERWAKPGRYQVRIQQAVAATPQDLARIAAERLFMEASRAEVEARGAGLERGLRKYNEALEQWRAAGVRKWEGQTLNNLGSTYRNLKQYEKAMDHYGRALVIMREIKERDREGAILYNLGTTYSNLSQYDQAREHYEQALPIWRETENKDGEALALNGLGIVHWTLKKNDTARKYYEQALIIRRETRNRNGEGQALNNLGLVYSALGQYDKARDHYEQALAIWRETKNKIGEGQALNNLGVVFRNLSQNEKAHECYEQSLVIKREMRDRDGEGQTLNNLGEVSSGGLRLYDRAREFYEQSLAIMREIRNRHYEGVALNNLCSVSQQLGQYDKAREYCAQSLTIAREIKNRHGEGQSLNNLGEIYRSLNEYDKARQHYELALAIMRETQDRLNEAIAHTNLGGIYQYLGQKEQAQAHLEQALAIRREIRDRDGEAQTLFGLAYLDRDRGRFLDALPKIELALSIKENLRTSYSNQDLRSTYSATAQLLYEFYIELLMYLHKQSPTAGHEAAALQASERFRARTLLEMLTEAGIDIRHGVDPQLVAAERSLQQQLNFKAQLQLKLLSVPHTPEQASAIAKEIDELTTQYQQIRGRIRQTSPRYATLTQPAVLGLKEIQQMLDRDTLLLEYFLGEKRSYLWVVSQTAVTGYELPTRAEIEDVARRVYESFSTSNAAVDKSYAEAANALSRMLLGPAAAQLGKKRLLVVSDGPLQYLPFAALPIPQVASDNRQGSSNRGRNRLSSIVPLIVEHEVVTLPSASLLAVLRRELSDRTPAPKMVAALADPVFDRDDPRIKRNPQTPLPGSPALQLPPELERSVRDSGGLSFDRLSSSRVEAETIVGLARGESLKALDFDASRATALSEELGQYRVVHFATHGLLNSLHPELSGLVLSLVDENGRPQDGFLRTHEVYNLKLRADLVVLSACQTALGKDVRGEGLVGLTRGFMYAGTSRVLASLWRVPSKATAELMKRFYRGMLVEKLRPAAALRAAQIGMLRQTRWNEPYYWAAFVLQGEWQ